MWQRKKKFCGNIWLCNLLIFSVFIILGFYLISEGRCAVSDNQNAENTNSGITLKAKEIIADVIPSENEVEKFLTNGVSSENEEIKGNDDTEILKNDLSLQEPLVNTPDESEIIIDIQKNINNEEILASSDINDDANIFDDSSNYDDLLILETYVQGVDNVDYTYMYNLNGKKYISFSQVCSYLGIRYEVNDNKQIIFNFADDESNTFLIDIKKKTYQKQGSTIPFASNDFKFLDDTYFFSKEFYETVLDIDITVNTLDMLVNFDREKDFPSVTKWRAQRRRQDGLYTVARDGFSNYEKDERLVAAPVFDLSLGKGFVRSDATNSIEGSDSYAMNISMLAGGLDWNAYISGNSYNDRKPTARIYGSRDFLDEYENSFNLKILKVGDISGIGQSYFTNGGQGRGVVLSSFKDLVMSANKTITLTGPLQDGWEVELYWNEQLIGFKQHGVNGQYNFPDIPVSYGLNTFKLVYYGPYGEIRTEYERYYSGTSPVKKGEFGYNFSGYEPNRYLIEENEPFKPIGDNIPVVDFMGYYGVSDYTTAIFGLTQTPDAEKNEETMHFGVAGAQVALQGASLQYNLEQNLDSQKVGHHLDLQGDVYVGNIYTSYDYYNGIHSPLSYVNNNYLKDKFSTRFSSTLPYNVPFYLDYGYGTLENNRKFDNVNVRFSKRLPYDIYTTVEDSYYHYLGDQEDSNTIKTNVYKQWENYSLETYVLYETMFEKKFTEFTSRIDYRTGRNTYLSGRYTRNLVDKRNIYSISGGQVFDFGGLTFTLETDDDLNVTTYLTYNISFSKVPNQNKLKTSANSKLSRIGTVFVHASDENGNPLEDVGFKANSLEKEEYTDENGNAFLTDMQTYERVILETDLETLPDISLVPEQEQRKLVLRPGTVREVEMKFTHRGAVEGKLENFGYRMFGYQISAVDDKNEEVASTFTDLDGYFILDNVPYGTYDIVVRKDGKILAQKSKVLINDISVFLDEKIAVSLDRNDLYDEYDEYEEYDENEILQDELSVDEGQNDDSVIYEDEKTADDEYTEISSSQEDNAPNE